jgi:hypothetical protein
MTIEREKLLSKCRGLMTKTMEAGCTEDEALAALEKLRAIMDAHEISESELNLTKEEKAVFRSEPKGTSDPHLIKFNLVAAVADFRGCEGWRAGRRGEKHIVFCGLQSDVEFASWLLDHLAAFVQNEIVKYLMEARPDNQDRRSAAKSFALGCCHRIGERVSELCRNREQNLATATKNTRELVVVKGAIVKAKLKEFDIHIGTCSSGICSDGASYAAGHAAGAGASFGRPVSGRNATPRLR